MIYIQSQQSTFPKAIYIGDKAELRCSFSSGSALQTGTLSAQSFLQPIDFSLYDINEITLQKSETDYYTLVINFTPWRTGQISFPDFQLEGAGTLHFEAVQIKSLVEQQGVTDIKNFSSPLLLPGTAYKIYGGIAVFVVLLIVVIRLIVKWRSVVLWFKNVKLKRRYARSKKATVRALKALGSKNETPAEICTKLQKLMREYLELRLEYPFTKTLTSEMSMAFEKATSGLADEKRQDAFDSIISIFVRTDFIRFSHTQKSKFEEGELAGIIKNLIDAITVIEEGGTADA
ncbi:MAG: hypothetical protein J6T20_04520 [Treponema sp.]|nr:hypothetical protein [Treponema sp.]